MPKAKDPSAKNKDTPKPLTRAEMERQMENFRVPCPECGREVPRKLLLPYGGLTLCPACFVEASKRARGEARKSSVPFYMRARRYATMANSWRMRRSNCNCGR